MGRKGVSKRKPKQNKQVTEKSKASPIPGNEIKPSADSNKEYKKR